MEFSLPLPEHLESGSIILQQWMSFYNSFRNHLNIMSPDHPCVELTSILLYAAQNQISNICASLEMDNIDFAKLNRVLTTIENLCLPYFLVLFERHRYFNLEKIAPVATSDFSGVISNQADLCEFGAFKNSILSLSVHSDIKSEEVYDNIHTLLNLGSSSSTALAQQSGEDIHDSVSKENCSERKTEVKYGSDSTESLNISSFEGDTSSFKATATQIKSSKTNQQKNTTHLTEKKGRQQKCSKTLVNLGKEHGRGRHSESAVCKIVPKARSKIKLKRLQCPVCSDIKFGEQSLRNHVSSVHFGKKINADDLSCKICKMTFASVYDLKNHILVFDYHLNQESEENTFLCWNCGDLFPSLPIYKQHLDEHGVSCKFSCELCQNTFHSNSITWLVGHLKNHLSMRYKCHPCGRIFSKAGHLLEHAKKHQDLNAQIPCPTCGKNFVSEAKQKEHVLSHSGGKRYCCELCGRDFNQKNSFKRHKLWHADKKLFKCNFCTMRFFSRSELNKHMLAHTKKRDYVCDVCGKDFTYSWNLRQHRESHSGKKTHECHYCGRSYVYRKGLKLHWRTSCPGFSQKTADTNVIVSHSMTNDIHTATSSQNNIIAQHPVMNFSREEIPSFQRDIYVSYPS